MATLNELQQRLAVASERNRQNAETREKLETEMKETYGCSTVEELKAFAEAEGVGFGKIGPPMRAGRGLSRFAPGPSFWRRPACKRPTWRARRPSRAGNPSASSISSCTAPRLK